MADQDGRIAVVTGAGRGLGRAVALGLFSRGATVVAVARSAEQLAETQHLAHASGGPGSIGAVTCDVSHHDAVAQLKRDVEERVGRPTILVNAAGIFGPMALIKDADPVAWRDTILVDAVAPLYLVNAFLAGMLDEGWGRIINVTSAASLHPPGPVNSAYGTAKAALNQMTRHLAAEIAGTGVTANVIHPGDVKTAMWADVRERVAGMGPVAENYIAWADWVEQTGGDPPEKAVDLVLRLTSDAGGSTNGEFCWIEDPLQAPVPSWEPPSEHRPWLDDAGDPER